MAFFHQHENTPLRKQFSLQVAFPVAVIANGLFVVVQLIFSYVANSTSLLADGIHNLGDVLSLLLAWVANHLLARLPTAQSTYGVKKASILAALVNCLLLVFTCGIIATEAMYKFFHPSQVHAQMVMVVAAVGIIVNGVTATFFVGTQDDLNIRAAFLHLFYDALISAGVVFSAIVIYWTEWQWIDPCVGLLIAFIIFKGTWRLLLDSFRLIMDGVPRDVSITKIRQLLENQPGVCGLHDLHVWALSTRENALSVHLWMPEASLTDLARRRLSQQLREEYNVHHTTIQVECVQDECEDSCMPYL